MCKQKLFLFVKDNYHLSKNLREGGQLYFRNEKRKQKKKQKRKKKKKTEKKKTEKNK